MKKILSFLLIIVLCLTIIPNQNANASIKLNKTKLILDEGTSFTLYLSKITKTATWTSSNNSIAKVSTKGKVTAVKAGVAIITAASSGKKYKCSVTVNKSFNSEDALKNTGTEIHTIGKGVLDIITNNYSFPYSIEATIVYYDENDDMIGKSDDQINYVDIGHTSVLYFSAPQDGDYNDVSYKRYEIKYSINKITDYKSNASEIDCKSNIGSDNVMVQVTNNSNESAEFTKIFIIFYKNGEIVGADDQYADVQNPNDIDYLEFSFPYDDNYDTVQVDDYKVFVNYSYRY